MCCLSVRMVFDIRQQPFNRFTKQLNSIFPTFWNFVHNKRLSEVMDMRELLMGLVRCFRVYSFISLRCSSICISNISLLILLVISGYPCWLVNSYFCAMILFKEMRMEIFHITGKTVSGALWSFTNHIDDILKKKKKPAV